MEQSHPGIGLKIWNYSLYHSEPDRYSYNTGVGRDAGANIVYGKSNTFAGYSSAPSMYAGSGNVAVGVNTLRQSVFGNNLTAIGFNAGRDTNDSTESVFIGCNSGRGTKSANRSVLIGANSGWGLGSDLSDTLVVQNQSVATSNPLISGLFRTDTRTAQSLGVNVAPENIKNATLHLQYSTAPVGLLDPHPDASCLLIARGGHTGLTIATTNASRGSIFFADPESANVGGIMYDHAVNRLSLRADGVYRMQLGSAGLWIKDAMKTSEPAAGSKELWVDGSGFVKWRA